MSFDVHLQAFRDGDSTVLDAGRIRSTLAPYVSEIDSDLGSVRLAITDGGADLYGWGNLESGFMVNHIEGRNMWDLLVQVATEHGLSILPIGCPVAVTDRRAVSDLPPELRSLQVAVVSSGAELLAVIEERRWPCPVCFLPVLSSRPYAKWPPADMRSITPPYEDELGMPSYEVCPNCQFEFGNDDNPGTAAPVSFDTYRDEWRELG